MLTHKEYLLQIMDITEQLIRVGLSNSQNYPTLEKTTPSRYEIGYSGMQDLAVVLKNIRYDQIYDELDSGKNDNIKLIDGALIQMMYSFEGVALIRHRLAFFPSPYFEDFQNEPELYELDEIYADIIAKNIIPFPLRFDFDPDRHQEIEHPKSHLTLGQFKNCRIPVAFPLTPCVFISFILRNFYNTAFRKFTDELSLPSVILQQTITTDEKKLLHMTLS